MEGLRMLSSARQRDEQRAAAKVNVRSLVQPRIVISLNSWYWGVFSVKGSQSRVLHATRTSLLVFCRQMKPKIKDWRFLAEIPARADHMLGCATRGGSALTRCGLRAYVHRARPQPRVCVGLNPGTGVYIRIQFRKFRLKILLETMTHP